MTMALAAYRALLRQITQTFHGDLNAIRAASKEARARFNAGKGAGNPSEIKQMLAFAEETRLFLKENIVQARKSSCGTYTVQPRDAHKLKDISSELTQAS